VQTGTVVQTGTMVGCSTFAIGKTCLFASDGNGGENGLKTRDIKNVRRKASEKALNTVGTT
jgi:hypothetical protein